jgi:tRNA pseudouridine55 synthase
MTNRHPLHGWLIINKPQGPSSAQVVGKVKHLLKPLKIGHGGTLDPLATGVLPLALGEATKTVGFMLDGDKSYQFTLKFGSTTTTDDSAGETTATTASRPTEAALKAILPQFTGPIRQMPPAVSALKVGGERAYNLVRKGEVPQLAARPVTIHALKLLSYDGQEAKLEADVSKGTYIRSLARDIAAALGSLGHVSALHRTKHGPFSIADAVTLDNLAQMTEKPPILPVKAALDGLPAHTLTPEQAQRLRHGQVLSTAYPQGLALMVGEDGQPVAMAEISANGTAKAQRVFNL